MIELNKTLKKYLSQLIAIGIIYLCLGIFCSWVIIKSSPEIPLIYWPLIVVALVFGYIAAIKYPAGGNVNYYLTKHTLTEDERTLDSLILKYRDITIITIICLIASIIIIAFGIKKNNSEIFFSFDMLVGSSIFPLITMGMLGVGIKYISAWFNIKKNIKIKNGIQYINLKNDK
jgi:hypothetical protein